MERTWDKYNGDRIQSFFRIQEGRELRFGSDLWQKVNSRLDCRGKEGGGPIMTLRRGLYVSFVLSISLCATGAEA